MNYNKAELCKDCKMPVEELNKSERDLVAISSVMKQIGEALSKADTLYQSQNIERKMGRELKEAREGAKRGGDRSSSQYYSDILYTDKNMKTVRTEISQVANKVSHILEALSALRDKDYHYR